MLPHLVIILAFAVDRVTKWWAADFLADGAIADVHPLLKLQPVYNSGIAFGMFQGIGPAIGWLTIGVVVGLYIFMRRTPHKLSLLRIGLALIIGGALGNLVDRIIVGEVLDFINTPLRPGIFNMADVMIYLGVFLSVLGLFLQQSKAEPVLSKPNNQSSDLFPPDREDHI